MPALSALLTSVVALATTAGSAATAPVPCLRPPVEAPVTDRFRPGDCPYCAGNRGLQYDVAPGAAVHAAAAGAVTFSGTVAGTYYVVVRHADGLRATYGRLAGSHLRLGDPVAAGALVGRVGIDGFHFGLRRGNEYLDPAPYLGRLQVRPYLVPTDGTPRRDAPPPRLVCPARR